MGRYGLWGRGDGGRWMQAGAGVAVVVALVVAALTWPDPATALLALIVLLLALALVGRSGPAQRLEPAPRPPESEPTSSQPAAARPAPRGAPQGGPALSMTWPKGQVRLRVLVAEDHEINRRMLAALLDGLGHDAHFAATGTQAVAALRTQPFDVVLMDLAMPEMDGIAATREIRALPDSRQAAVPIVALTADEMPQARGRCLLAGMNDFLTKPINADALAVCLRRLFGEQAHGRLAAAGVPGPPVGPALLDHETLNSVLGAMPRERVVELVERFFADAPQALQLLRVAIRDVKLQELRVGTHGLRGAALNLGMSALASTAGAIHDGASHLAAHEVALLLQRLELQLRDTHEALQAMGLAQGAPVPSG